VSPLTVAPKKPAMPMRSSSGPVKAAGLLVTQAIATPCPQRRERRHHAFVEGGGEAIDPA
jgi:hypothetical protein